MYLYVAFIMINIHTHVHVYLQILRLETCIHFELEFEYFKVAFYANYIIQHVHYAIISVCVSQYCAMIIILSVMITITYTVYMYFQVSVFVK